MDDLLVQFQEGNDAADEDGAGEGHTTELLLFVHEGVTFGVAATRVDVIIGYKTPAPLPASVPGFAGVLQDRGRIVALLRSPLGTPPASGAGEPRRVVICRTARGFVGLPCMETRAVGPVTLTEHPEHGRLVDSSAGPVVVLEPDQLVPRQGVRS